MRLGKTKRRPVVPAGREGPIKPPGVEDDLRRRPDKSPQRPAPGRGVFPGGQDAPVRPRAGGDRQAAFRALPRRGQAVEGVAATLAEDGSFVGYDYASAGHALMV